MIYGNPRMSNMPFASSQFYAQNLPLNPLNSANIMNGIASNHLPLHTSLGVDYLNKMHFQSALPAQNLFNTFPKNQLNQLHHMRNGFAYSKEYLASAQMHNYQKNCDDLMNRNSYLVSMRQNQLKQNQMNIASYQGGLHVSAGQLSVMNHNLDSHESCDEEEYVNVMM